MNSLHNIPAGDPNKLINVIVEIPVGSKIKFEYDKDLGVIKADRLLYTAFSYPFNYGFVPGTLSEDHDPLDIVVLSSEPIYPGILIECRVVGMLETEDEEGGDAKVIAVPKAKVDPFLSHIESVNDLPDSEKNRIRHFYENYKSLEPGKWVKVTGWKDKTEAIHEVEQAISRFQKNSSK
jgi:inorganic pyrophosphatase